MEGHWVGLENGPQQRSKHGEDGKQRAQRNNKIINLSGLCGSNERSEWAVSCRIKTEAISNILSDWIRQRWLTVSSYFAGHAAMKGYSSKEVKSG